MENDMDGLQRWRSCLRWRDLLVVCLLTASGGVAPVLAVTDAGPAEGGVATVEDGTMAARLQAAQALYDKRCAACHDHPRNNIPPRESLGYRNPEMVVHALSRGSMSAMAAGLDERQIRGLARLLTGREPSARQGEAGPACAAPVDRVAVGEADWPVVGRDLHNTRFQPEPGFAPGQVGSLTLQWAWAYPGGASGPPVVADGVVFLASGLGEVIALDLGTGCEYWRHATGRGVRTVTVGTPPGRDSAIVLFGNDRGEVSALDAASGEHLWQRRVEEHVLGRITSPPVLSGDRVVVPISSIEDPLTHNPEHPCCTARGAVAALSAASGELLWKTPTIPLPLRELPPEHGVARHGPAGGSVFTPLAVDEVRGRVYVATAESFNRDNPPGTYAVLALDLRSGARLWEHQFVPDAAERARVCAALAETDCRNVFSMSTAPMLFRDPSGDERLLVGQKWGWLYALDPARDGALAWRRRLGEGGDMGGIMYGGSLASETALMPVADVDAELPGGLAAMDVRDGRLLWQRAGTRRPCSWGGRGCSSANTAALTAIPGVVFAGSWDGYLAAHDEASGEPLWLFDTAGRFPAVNGGEARGGQVSGYPVVVVDGRVLVTSGASSMARPGNALLVFAPAAAGTATEATAADGP